MDGLLRFVRCHWALVLMLAAMFPGSPLLAQRPWQGPRYPVNPKALAAGCPGFAEPDRSIAPPIVDYSGVPTIARAVQDSDLVVVGTVKSVAWRPGPPANEDPIAVVTFRSAIPLMIKPGLVLKAPPLIRAPGGIAVVRGKCVNADEVGEWIEAGRNYLVFAYRASDTHDLWTGAWYEIASDGKLQAVGNLAPFLNGKPAAKVEAEIRAEALKGTSK